MQDQNHSAALSHGEKLSGFLPALKAKAFDLSKLLLSGPYKQKRPGGGTDFWQFRNFEEGDETKTIDWRQSAKSPQDILVRQQEKQNLQKHFFWLERSASMDFPGSDFFENKRGQSCVMALAFVFALMECDEKTALLERADAFSIDEIAASFCEYTGHQSGFPKTAGHLPAGSWAYVIGDFWQPLEEFEIFVKQLKNKTRRGVFMQVIDPAELTLPYNGRVLFQDVQTAGRQDIQNVKAVRLQYQEKIEAHNERLQEICTREQFHFFRYVLNQDLKKFIKHVWFQIREAQA